MNDQTATTKRSTTVDYLGFAELTLGHIHLVAVQLVHVGHHLGALDRQQNEARSHLRRQGAME